MTLPSSDVADRPQRLNASVVRAGVADVLCLAGLLTLAWWLYRPETMRAVDYVDFPENILLMEGHEGFLGRFLALSQAYTAHGRWHPLSSAVLAAQWSFFEFWTPGWHLVRFILLSTVTGLALTLYRRLGLNAAGATAAASLFVVAPPAINGWTRLGTGEPLGTLFLLIACHLALDLRRRGAQWLLALSVCAVVWSKEIMAGALFFPLLLAFTAGTSGDLSFVRMGWERLRRLAPTALAIVAAIIPVLVAYASANPGSFARRYGAGGFAVVDLIGISITAWSPVLPAPGNPWSLALIGLTVFLMAAGWMAALRRSEGRSHNVVVLVAALGMPLIGALLYLPWPFYILIYALPFLSGGAILLGQAVSALTAAGRLDRVIALACVLPVATFAALTAANASARTTALHGAIAASIQRVGETPVYDSVLVAVAEDQFDPDGNFGPRFPQYARMLGLQWPPVRDATCEEAGRTEQQGVLVLIVSEMCPGVSLGDSSIVFKYVRYDWPNPRPYYDSITVVLRGLLSASTR